MQALDWGLILTSVLINASGQMLLKNGATRLGTDTVSLRRPMATLWAVVTCWPIVLGLSGYVVSVFVWIAVLTRVQVSVAYPMASLGYVITTFLAWRFFHERVSPLRLAGIAVICLGVYLVGHSAPSH